ncbi:MAG: hypothetical protein BMS9Abin23_0189 [Thermodesulfobacteriota bacterium]|nr:MAG: hypothetical protein BMS9Abin23_0189 [Thermodesulfobacteriota bacterium]
MAYTKRSCWALIVFSIFVLLPSKGLALKIDPYQFRIFRGTLSLAYEKENRDVSGFDEDTSGFTQTYSLDFLGNVLTPRLMIYNGVLIFTRQDFSADGVETDSNSLSYGLTTTFLRKSRIPLTLFGNNYSSDTTTGSETFDNTTSQYGLSWSGRFIRLPIINVQATRTTEDQDGSENQQTDIFLNMEKYWGPSVNRFDYTGTFYKSLNSDDSSSSTNINFSNSTSLTKHTTFSVGASRAVSDIQTSDSTDTTYGLSMSLLSKPGRFFEQSHNLTYFKSNTGGSDYSGTTYSGNLRYKVSEKISSTLSLSITDSSNESETTTEDSKSVSTGMDLSYSITDNLYLSENIFYLRNDSTSSGTTDSNLLDREYLSATSSINYRRKMYWALLFSSYGLGYVKDSDTEGGGGSGIQQYITASLSRIDFNNYVLFDISATDNRIKQISGTIHGGTQEYDFRAYNKKWEKYVDLSAEFKKYANTSQFSALEERSQDIYLRAATRFLRNTRFSVNYNNSHYFTDLSGFSNSSTVYASASHSRNILGGRLSFSLNYGISNRTFTDGSDTTKTANYNLSYARVIIRNMQWKIYAQRTDSNTDDVISEVTTFSNTLYYRLRAWVFSVNHNYSLEHTSTSEVKENRFLIKASRSFVRVF